MKKRILSILLCLCMAISLLPTAALAATYNSWEAATAEGVTLTADTDTVTIGGVAYTYKGDASTSGVDLAPYNGFSEMALKETCCWKAGSGYVLYKPTVGSVDWSSDDVTTSAEVTLHDAEISTASAFALKLPVNSPSSTAYPVPVTVHVEGTNSLTTNTTTYTAVYHLAGDATFTGGGILSIVGCLYNGGAVTIDSGTQVTVNGGDSNCVGGNLTVTGSGSKLTIASGTKLLVDGASSTVTVENGAVLENNGTLSMYNRTKDNPGITGDISGNGTFQFGDLSSQLYCLVDGEFIAYGGDVGTSGLDLSSSAPTETTRYKAGNGYISYTPAVTGDNAANAKLELHGATINTTSGRALYLPGEAVAITVTGDNSLTANGSYNYAVDPSAQAVNITGGGNLSLTGNRGIASWDGSTPSVTVDIDGDLVITTTTSNSIYAHGDIEISAASISTGIINAGSGSFTANAKTGNLTIDNGTSNSTAVIAHNITLNAPNGAISVAGTGSKLLENSGMVTLNAKGNIAFTSSNTSSTPILFGTGVSITSDAGSIDVTTSGYSGIEKTDGCTGGGGVTLNAAKDITLNADTTAISTSAEDVNLTAGGKLTSTSKYGFQVRELTIKANEVSIEGTQQNGIYATSVAITNPTGGNCKRVSVTGSGSDSWAAIRATGSADTGNITVKADDLFICGKNSAKAISTLGTVTIGDAGMIVGAISAGTDSIDSRILRAANGGKLDYNGLNLETPPGEATYYEADSGYFIYTPAEGTASASLALHLANYQATVGLPNSPIALILNGANEAFVISAKDNVTISGSGSLDAYRIENEDENAELTINSGAVLNTLYQTKNAQDVYTNTIYGRYTTNDQYGVSVHNGSLLKLAPGAVLTLEENGYLYFEQNSLLANMVIGADASIVNNTFIMLPQGTTPAQIAALPLSGTGVVRVATVYNEVGRATSWTTYTNDGVALKTVSGDLDLSTGDHSGATLADDGYTFSDNILTLGNVYIENDLTLPCDTAVTINTTASSIISGDITAASDAGGYNHPIALTFTGTAPLTIIGGICGGVNGDTVTAQGGARVTVNGYISLGGSGTGSTLNVTGSGTTLNVSSSNGPAVICDTVNIGSGAALTISAEGTGSIGVEALSGGVNVTGGSTLTVGCDYGVYIIGGKLTVDSTSKLITNGAVAPFCIVGAENSTQDSVLSLAVDLPSGTEIASRQATNGSGTTHTYWSLVPTNGNLTVSDMDNTPVTLAGTVTGTLTFSKAASNPTGGGSGSTSYTLTFETNGGSKISSVSKTSGSAVDLGEYKPTRDGYTFSGWYSDAELTSKITSVTLTKNMTVYAKWTEKITNPFVDVSDSDYYHDAVLWAVGKSITSGTSANAFTPNENCTRAQMVTFLWRAMGSPEPSTSSCPFTDVAQGDYYYKAVLWAVEKGITEGSSATSFGSDDVVTRGQAVTFMWRAAGKPSAVSANPFMDVTADAYYYNAVLWAVEKGITQGSSAVSFNPSSPCTRAQTVTFLHRYIGE